MAPPNIQGRATDGSIAWYVCAQTQLAVARQMSSRSPVLLTVPSMLMVSSPDMTLEPENVFEFNTGLAMRASL